ncbi:ParB/RepB/Spo0J family partition protein [Reyranella sp.]|uniref:ParB/RepB/Spo0J family partition protein n=1 Tax=Reyranella sp. TaxID=1929291 RepID=UPI003C79F6C9
MANTFKAPLQKAVVGWLATHPDVTIAELARRAEVDKGDLSKINSGAKPSLNMESAGRLAKAMGTTVEGLLAGDAAATPALAPPPTDVRIDSQALAVGVRLVPLSIIDPSPDNPRKTFDKEALAELAASIAEQGLLQPIVVRPVGARFEIVAGERRFRALTLNKAADALCVVREGDDDGNTRALRIIENLQREDISAMEEAEAFVELTATDPARWTPKSIGLAIGMTERFVEQRLALARGLSPAAKKAVHNGTLGIEAARTFASFPAARQDEALKIDWVARGDAKQVRDFMMRSAIPVSKAAFDVAAYTGEILTEGRNRWFMDPKEFDKLQAAAMKAKLKQLQTEFPDARQIDQHRTYDWVWADTGESVQSGGRKVDPKKAKVPTEKQTAIVWIDHSRVVHVARNVTFRRTYEAAAKRDRKPTAKELAERETQNEQNYVEAQFNEAMRTEVAKRPALVARLALHSQLSGWTPLTDDMVAAFGNGARNALEPALRPGGKGNWKSYQASDEGPDLLWEALVGLDDEQVTILHGRLVAMRAVNMFNGWAEPLTVTVAELLELTLPSHIEREVELDDDTADQAEAA